MTVFSSMATMVLIVLAAAGGGAPPPPAFSAADLLVEAREAMAAGDYQQSLQRYAELRQRLPDEPTIPYNMGVAAYRAGDYQRAADLFEQALALAEAPAMRSRSAYNLGTAAYAGSLQDQEQFQADQIGQQLDQSTKELGEVLRHFRQALDADPTDEDAKANAELAYRRLQAIEQLKELMEQQQSGEQSEGDQEQQSQPEGQDQKQDEGDQQQSEQQQPQPGEQQDNEQSQPQPGEQGDEQQAQQAQAQAGEESQGEQQEALAAEAQEGDEPQDGERRAMSREEAERLLQAVRDKERQRREALARREAARRGKADKDW